MNHLDKLNEFFAKKWALPLLYFVLIILNVIFPPITSRGYAAQDTGRVISSLLNTSIIPYVWLAPVFHIATIILVIIIWRLGVKVSRVFSLYIGINYIFIGLIQNFGETWEFGFVILIGTMITEFIIGFLWIWDAYDPKTESKFEKLPLWRYWTIPLAILAYWCPINSTQNMGPYFNPLFLLISPGYGLTFCMTTPVFLCILTLFYPHVNKPALKITACAGFIMGVLNMFSLLIPYTFWMGILHIPLLSISIYVFILPKIMKNEPKIVNQELVKIPHVQGRLIGEVNIGKLEDFLIAEKSTEGVEVGDIVEIIGGPFKGEKAKITRVDTTEDVVILVLCESTRPIPIKVHADFIKKIISKEKRKPEMK